MFSTRVSTPIKRIFSVYRLDRVFRQYLRNIRLGLVTGPSTDGPVREVNKATTAETVAGTYNGDRPVGRVVVCVCWEGGKTVQYSNFLGDCRTRFTSLETRVTAKISFSEENQEIQIEKRIGFK